MVLANFTFGCEKWLVLIKLEKAFGKSLIGWRKPRQKKYSNHEAFECLAVTMSIHGSFVCVKIADGSVNRCVLDAFRSIESHKILEPG